METKKCNICKSEKLLNEFANDKSRKDGKQRHCKLCKRNYNKKHYLSQQEKYKENRKINFNKLKIKLHEFKNKPCIDCGNTYPHYVMDFDHLHSEQKIANISRLVSTKRSWHIIKKEIDKCELVCANCHRIRTQERYEKAEE